MDTAIIFTDGASRGNPGPGGWGAIVIRDGEATELGGREDRTTNNRMEIMAAVKALSILGNGSTPVGLYTDSRYLINGITKWAKDWAENGWKTKTKEDVLNKDLWEKLLAVSEGKEIAWNYVGGHSGIPGNERCDEIATAFADRKDPALFTGLIENYSLKNISGVAEGTPKEKSRKARSKDKAYSYISMVDGKIKTHATWKECEERVKGVSKARFIKAISPEEEAKIIEEWKQAS